MALRGGGDLMLDVPELMLAFDVLIVGLLEAFGLRENRPILGKWGRSPAAEGLDR